MTQKDKELLLKDLCARLPYGVIVVTPKGRGYICNINLTIFDYELGVNINPIIRDTFSINDVKPYLRLMSSMTEEEREELGYISHIVPLYDGSFGVDMRAYCKNSQPHYRRFSEFSTIEDWFNAHHFDYRGLIEKGLANEASEEVYSLNK